jgi:UDP-3-O-[3-hydroxymyristoyl] glucosamine N-acyltransferase
MTHLPSPDDVMRTVTTDMIARALRMARRKRRSVYISKTARGKAVDLESLDPRTTDGAKALAAFLTPPGRHYTFSGLGAPEEPNAINWRTINLPLWRRILVMVLVTMTFVMKGTPFKNKIYRLMGARIGRNVEIMQMVWLDHFRPELIFIGDNTLLGAFTRLTSHAYEGSGRFRYGIIEIGSHCTIGAGTGIGPILIEDNVRTLPGTTISPYLARIRAGSVVGYAPPPVKLADPTQTTAVESTASSS